MRNMENEIKEALKEQDQKLEAIFKSVEKTRKYFLIIVWVTIIMFVLPLIGMMFVIPSFIDSYSTSLNGLL